MLIEFRHQPDFGIWSVSHYDGKYVWLWPTPQSHEGLASLAGHAMIGVRRTAVQPVTNPDQLEIPNVRPHV